MFGASIGSKVELLALWVIMANEREAGNWRHFSLQVVFQLEYLGEEASSITSIFQCKAGEEPSSLAS